MFPGVGSIGRTEGTICVNVEIIALEAGERPPDNADWISVETLADGRYNIAGCVAGEQKVAFAGQRFATPEEAQLAGVFWARNLGARTIYVETAD